MLKEKYIEFKSALANQDIQKAEQNFQKGFNKAIEVFNKKIINQESFVMAEEKDLYATLFLFDNMLGLWSDKSMIEETIQFAQDMAVLVDNPKIKEMFLLFSYGMSEEGMDVNTFINKYLDLTKVDNEFPMFLVNFKDEVEELIPESLKN
jgi:hypothetical protein